MSLAEKAIAVSAIEAKTLEAINNAHIKWDDIDTSEVFASIQAEFMSEYLKVWDNQDTANTRFWSIVQKANFE